MSIASPAPTDQLLTGEELLEMGDIGPCELIDGRVVRMSPTGGEHGIIAFLIGRELGNFVEQRKLGWIGGGESGVYTQRKPDRVRGIDVYFISRQRSARRPGAKFLTVAPELIIEIVSPTDRWSDIRQKLEEYFAIGVERVWIIEPEDRVVLVYHSSTESTRLTDADTLRGEGLLNGFEMPVADLFAQE